MRHLETQKTDTLNRIVIGTTVFIIGFYLLTEHRAHLFGVLPFLLILACPLMHIFMHRGHGNHGALPDTEVDKYAKSKNTPEDGPKACL